MIDLCVVPVGVGVSLSRYIAACLEIIQERGLQHQMHPYGTVIEGPWDEVFDAVKACHERIHAMGAPRITTTIKLGTRIDRQQTMEDKIDSIRQQLGLMP